MENEPSQNDGEHGLDQSERFFLPKPVIPDETEGILMLFTEIKIDMGLLEMFKEFQNDENTAPLKLHSRQRGDILKRAEAQYKNSA